MRSEREPDQAWPLAIWKGERANITLVPQQLNIFWGELFVLSCRKRTLLRESFNGMSLQSWQSVRSTTEWRTQSHTLKQIFSIRWLMSTVIDDIDVRVLTLNFLFNTNQQGSLDFSTPSKGLAPSKLTYNWTNSCPKVQLLDKDVAEAKNWLTLELEAFALALK